MSTTTDDVVAVPVKLDDYIDQRGTRCDDAICTGCFAAPAIASNGPNVYCRACWAGMHGHDIAEDTMVRSIIGAAVAACADAGADEELVRDAVDQALAARWAERDDQPVTMAEWRAA